MKMKRKRLTQAVLAAAIAVALSAGPAWSRGKKPKAVDKEKTLGKAGTMTKSYDPETGVKRMEKTIGHGEKTMTLEKGPHSREDNDSREGTPLGRHRRALLGPEPRGETVFPRPGPKRLSRKGQGKRQVEVTRH